MLPTKLPSVASEGIQSNPWLPLAFKFQHPSGKEGDGWAALPESDPKPGARTKINVNSNNTNARFFVLINSSSVRNYIRAEMPSKTSLSGASLIWFQAVE